MYIDPPAFLLKESDEEIGRKRLGRRCANVFRVWGFREPEQSETFGVFEDHELKAMHSFAVDEDLPNSPEILYRAQVVVAILSIVELLYYDQPDRIKSWARDRDEALAGLTPYEVIEKRGLGGLEALLGHATQQLISRNLHVRRKN